MLPVQARARDSWRASLTRDSGSECHRRDSFTSHGPTPPPSRSRSRSDWHVPAAEVWHLGRGTGNLVIAGMPA